MLGKLLKYELKSSNILFLIGSGAVAFITLMTVATMVMIEYFGSDNLFIMMSTISVWGIYIITLLAIPFLTWILIFKRFYSNNFSHEGYLTFTLPVKTGEIYWSKYISAIIWKIWSWCIIIVSLTAVIITAAILSGVTFADFGEFINETLNDLKDLQYLFSEIGWSLPLYFVKSVLQFFLSTLIVYFAICIGQNFKAHRVIAGVGAWLIINWIMRIITQVVSAACLVAFTAIDTNSGGDSYFFVVGAFEFLIYAAVAVGGCIYSIRKMDKGLNLI